MLKSYKSLASRIIKNIPNVLVDKLHSKFKKYNFNKNTFLLKNIERIKELNIQVRWSKEKMDILAIFSNEDDNWIQLKENLAIDSIKRVKDCPTSEAWIELEFVFSETSKISIFTRLIKKEEIIGILESLILSEPYDNKMLEEYWE